MCSSDLVTATSLKRGVNEIGKNRNAEARTRLGVNAGVTGRILNLQVRCAQGHGRILLLSGNSNLVIDRLNAFDASYRALDLIFLSRSMDNTEERRFAVHHRYGNSQSR